MTTRRDALRTTFAWLGLAALQPRRALGATTLTAAQITHPTPLAGAARRRLTIDALVPTGPDFDAAAAVAAGLCCVIADMSMYPRSFDEAVHAFARWGSAFRTPEAPLRKVLRAADIEAARAEGKLAVVLACQDASILDASTRSVSPSNLDNLGLFYDLGLRVLQITHNEQNALGGSFREPHDSGLSLLGRSVVEAMNQLGMVVDLSHCGRQTTLDAIALSKRPCLISHTGCQALLATGRNKDDETIRRLAAAGGVVGIFNMSLWLTERPTASIEDVLDHIDHAVQVAGVEHVGFGSDGPVLAGPSSDEQLEGMRAYARRNLGLPGSERIPDHVITPELNAPDRLDRLATGLARRGHNEDAIDKIVGGNVLRVLREVCG